MYALPQLEVDIYSLRNKAELSPLEVLKWAKDNNCPWDENVYRYAAENGHLETLGESTGRMAQQTKRLCQC